MTRVITPAGVPAVQWTARLDSEPVADLAELIPLTAADHLVVVAAHPDDETLGLGGVLHRLARAGAWITVVVATNGEAAYGGGAAAAETLAGTRRRELDDALAALGVAADVRLLSLPDGGLSAHDDQLADAISAVIHQRRPGSAQQSSRVVVLATWLHDPHPDHAAVGRVARTAAYAAGCDLWWYPVWMRDRLDPADHSVPWSQLRTIRLEPAEVAAKAAAVAAYRSQTVAPTAEVGPVLPATALAQFTDGFELLITAAPTASSLAAHFDAAHDRTVPAWADPTSWYERRKREVLMASLPSETYERAWEPGASVGRLTVELARRCREVVASDVSPVAVQAAAGATAELPGVSVSVAHVPDDEPDLPDGSCDLVVLAEFLYYLDASARARTVALASRLLHPDGHVVVVHWRHFPDDAYCSGADANREVIARFGPSLVHHEEADFVLDVLCR